MVGLFDGRFRTGVDRVVRPAGAALVRTGLSPDHLTAFGLALSVPTAVAIATGRLGIGLALLIFSAVPDLLDGALAKASGRATVRGAFFDSVCDRVTDSLVLGGFAWYLQDRHGGHAALLPFAILGASLLISYLRAKAESLGFEAKGGLMERGERIGVLCIGLAFGFLLVPLLWVMLALTLLTAAQRFVKVWRQATLAEGLGSSTGASTAAAAPTVVAPHVPVVGPRAVRPLHADTSVGSATDTDTEALGDRTVAPGRDAVEPIGGPADPMLLTERWRAWRVSTGWVPRAERYPPGARRGAAGTPRRRRVQRQQAAGDAPLGARRRGSRRP